MPRLSDLAGLQGEGWRVIGDRPSPKVDDDGVPIPGSYTITLAGPGGAMRVVSLSTDVRPGPIDPVELNPAEVDFRVDGVVETARAGETPAETNSRIAQAEAATAASQAQKARADAELEQLRTLDKARQKNLTERGLYVDDNELARIDSDARQAGLNQDDLDLRRQTASDNNLNTRTANEIAAVNARTAAARAASDAKAQEAQIRFEETGQALDQAKFEREQADRDIANQLAQDKLELDQLTQRQSNEISQRANELRQRELEQRTKSEQETLQARQSEAAAQAATGVYGAERQAQTAAGTIGQNLLQQRQTGFTNLVNQSLQNIGGFSQGSAGRYGMLGGGLQGAPPAGAIGNILGGAYGLTGQMAGGQSTLDAAAAAVRNASPGAYTSPQGQAAMAVLTQMFDKYRQLSGGAPAPQEAAVRAATTTAQTGGLQAPQTAPTPQQVANQQVASQQTAAATQQAGGTGFGGPIGNNPMLAAVQAANRARASQQTAAATQQAMGGGFGGGIGGGFQAPQTQPTIVMNF